MRFSILSTLLLVCAWRDGGVSAMPANPEALKYEQPDGSETPLIHLRGDEHYHWMADTAGYTILQDENEWYVYAKKEGGKLVSSGARVGYANPKKMGLVPNLTDDHETDQIPLEDEYQYARFEQSVEHRSLRPGKNLCNGGSCTLVNLVILVRFQDHARRLLPDRSDYDTLFNNNGATSDDTAPTGSVSDVFLANSYGNFKVTSTISNWITVSNTERKTAGNRNGMRTDGANQSWNEALTTYENGVRGMASFDKNSDGVFDAICLMHSGVGAEAGGTDCEGGADQTGRIWSHATAGNFYVSREGIKTNRYYVSTAIWGRCPPGGANTLWAIARIAVIAHEMGHFLGLPDLYDGKEGQGVGRFDLQGQCWGWKRNQKFPPMLGAWTKIQLGWAEVIDVTASAVLRIEAACKSSKVYKISHGMPDGEYLLLENRAGCSFDSELSPKKKSRYRGGLAIWHIDETNSELSFTTPGHPGSRDWPKTHYKVALIQCDGKWGLEKGESQGDENDLCKHDPEKVLKKNKKQGYKIGPEGLTLNTGKVIPDTTTDSYSGGALVPTGITIEAGEAHETMTVTVTLDPPNRAPASDVEMSDELPMNEEVDSDDEPEGEVRPQEETESVDCDNDENDVIRIKIGGGDGERTKTCKFVGKNKGRVGMEGVCDLQNLMANELVKHTCRKECLAECQD